MVELAKKVYLFIFVAFTWQKLFFHNGAGGHFGFTPLEKNAGIFGDTGAKYFSKSLMKSNKSSKHLSQKVAMKVKFFTLLLGWGWSPIPIMSDVEFELPNKLERRRL